jgi:N-methylhydantoinase B
VISAEAARGIDGVALREDGALDAAATDARRAALRKERVTGAVAGKGELVFTGRGKHRYGDAFHMDFERGEIRCGHCSHVLGAPGQNLAASLKEFDAPLWAAGAVRGEDYDEGRFKLRHLCCGHCGALVDVQVALDGAPRPGMRMALS